MAGRGIRVPFVADVAQWLSGTRKIEDDLDQLTDQLQQTARESERSAERVERDWEQAGRESADAFDRLARDASDSFDRVEREAERAGKEASDGLERGIRKGSFRGAAGALAAEAGSEFIESWGEAVREGNPAGVIREVFSNAALLGAAAGGPIGAAAGLAVSAFVTPLIDGIQKERERVAAALNTYFAAGESAAAEAGTRDWAAYRDAFFAGQDRDDLLTSALGAESARDAVQKLTDQTGALSESIRNDVIIALTDTGAAGEAAQQRIAAAAEQTAREYEAADLELLSQATRGERITSQERARKDQLQQQTAELRTALGWIEKQDTELGQALGTSRQLWRSARDIEDANRRAAGGAAALAREYANGKEEAARLKGALDQIPRRIPVSVIVTETRRDTAMANRAGQGIQP